MRDLFGDYLSDDPAQAAEQVLAKFRGRELVKFKRALKGRQKVDWDRHLYCARVLIKRMGSGTEWETISADRQRAIEERSEALGIDVADTEQFWRTVADVILPFDRAKWDPLKEKHWDLFRLLRTKPTDHFQALKEAKTSRPTPPAANAAAYRQTRREPEKDDESNPKISWEQAMKENPGLAKFMGGVAKPIPGEKGASDLSQTQNDIRRRLLEE